MPNYFRSTQNGNGGGYLMPRVKFGAAAANPLTKSQALQVQTSVGYSTGDENPWGKLGGIAAAAPIDVLDNIGQLFPGVQKGQINDAVYDAIGMPGAAKFVRENKDAVDVGAGLLGAIGIGWATEAAMGRMGASAWFASTGLAKAASPLLQWTGRAEAAAKAETAAMAANGESLGWLQGANFGLVTSHVVTGALKAGVSEVAIAAALHNNTAIWSEDMSTNVMFGLLGVGIGGAVGAISGRAMVKRWANSPTVQGAFASAADPSGYERMGSEMPTTGMPNVQNRNQAKLSSIVTGNMLNARDVQSATTALSADRGAIKTGTEIETRTVLQQIARRGDDHIPDSSFSIFKGGQSEAKLTPEGMHLTEALHDDPTLLLGADSVAKTLDADASLASREANIKGLEKSVDATGAPRMADRIKAKFLRKQVPLAIVDGVTVPVEQAKVFFKHNPTELTYRPTAAGAHELQWEGFSGSQFVMDETGKLNKPIDQLTTPDLISVGEAGNRILKTMKAKNMPLIVPAKANFLQLDFATEYAKRGGLVDFSKSGHADINAARVESMKQKAARLGSFQDMDMEARFRLNLPQASSVERVTDAGGSVLRKMVNAATVPGATTADLMNLRKSMQQVTELRQSAEALDNLEGNFFGFNRSKNELKTWHTPLLAFFEEPDVAKWTKFQLQDSIAETRAVQIKIMQSKTKSAPLASGLSQMIMNGPDARVAMGVSSLANSQLPGTTHVAGAVASQFLTQAMRNRFTPVLQAAQNIRRLVNRGTEAMVNEALKEIKPFYDQFSSVSGRQSRVLFNQYLSNSAGWDIKGVRQNADGYFVFELDANSTTNARRLGRPVNKGELMPNLLSGNPIALDQTGEQARQAFERVFTKLLKERNAVREARGLNPIQLKDFFTPPPNTTGKLVGFTLDASNRVVEGGAIVARSEAEFKAMRADLESRLPPGSRFMRKEEIELHGDLWDQAGLDFIDPTKMAAPAKHQSGKLFSDTVNPNALEDAVSYIKSGYEQVGNGTVRTIFAPQLAIAKIRNIAAGAAPTAKSHLKDIWQEYEQTLMGVSPLVNPRGALQLSGAADKLMDKVIATAWPTMTNAVSSLHLQDVLDKVAFKGGLSKVSSFSDLATELGPYMPFKDAIDYASYTHRIAPPPTAKGVARQMNRIGAAVVLRWLEVPQAAMNMAGIITNMPGLLTAANVPIIGRVGGVGVVDQVKIMARGFKRMMAEGDAGWQHSSIDWQEMVKNGDATQDAMEIHKQFSLMDSHNGFQKVLLGDPSAKGKLAKLGLEGIASYLTDTSENLSRIWAHHVGLELADLHGITGLEARHNFARQIANDTIANYDPLNRPEIFHSAFGNMYGLFLSYSQNYYQRLFRYIEDKDYKSVGVALAMQGAMFGFTGIPGSRQVMDLIGGENKGDSVMDGIYKRFGPAAGSVVAGGGFNQLITILGLPAVSLNTRGDMNFRHPALDFATSGQIALPIGLEVLKDVIKGTWDAASSLVDPSVPHSAQYAAEVMARTMPNRMLRGTLSVLAAGGKESDASGNLVSENKSVFETVYRSLGLRSARQQSEIEAYYGNQKATAMDSQRMDGVRKATRGLIRSGKMDELPGVFQKYLDAGGKPWNYATWIRGMIADAGDTRTANQLQKALRNPAQQVLAQRIRNYTGM